MTLGIHLAVARIAWRWCETVRLSAIWVPRASVASPPKLCQEN